MFKAFYLFCILIMASCKSAEETPEASTQTAAQFASNIETAPFDSEKYTEADSLADTKIKKYKIRLVEGKNKKGGYTKIKYVNTLQLLKLNRYDAKNQYWDEKILQSKISYLKNNNAGGRIELIVIRSDVDSANLKNFAVAINDIEGKELFRKDLPAIVALPSRINKHNWNSHKIDIPEKLRPPFYIYVYDKAEEKPFVFSVAAR